MRKFFTSIATVALAAVLTASSVAAPVDVTTKGRRVDATKTVATATMESKKDARAAANLSRFQTKGQAKAANRFASVKGTPLRYRPASMLNTPVREVEGLSFCASVLYDNATQNVGGICQFSADGSKTVVCSSSMTSANFGGVYLNGTYYNNLYLDYGFFVYAYSCAWDTNTWSEIYSNSLENYSIFAMSLGVAKDQTIYGCFYNEDGSAYEWGTLEIGAAAASRTKIADLDDIYFFTGFDADNQCWAINEDMDLGKVDVATGAFTKVAETGLDHKYMAGGVMSPDGKTIYQSVSTDSEDALYAIDLTTYAVTKVMDLDCEINGLYFPAAPVAAAAPAAPESVEVNFDGASMSGSVVFTAPATAVDGSDLTGTVNYTVLCNSKVAATGSAACGAEVSVPVTVDKAGEYLFSVYASNEAGDGLRTNSDLVWAGPDTPDAPENIQAVYDQTAGAFNVSWDAVASSVHNGYFDAANVVYTVNRYKNGKLDKVVAENLAATSLVDAVEYPTDGLVSYMYEVSATSDGVTSAAGTSGSVVLGTIKPPYNLAFTETDCLDQFTVIDANGDGRTWGWMGDYIYCSYNSANDMDDYVVTAAVSLEAGKSYDFSFTAWAYSANYPERVEALFGNAPTVEGLTEVIVEPTDLTDKTPVTLSGTVSIAEAGDYYFAIHGISDADQFYLCIGEIAISAAYSPNAPGAVQNVTFKGVYDGSPKATVSFDAPTTTVKGGDLTSIDKIEVSRDGELVKTFENPAPGAALSFEDEADEMGEYTYSFVGYNAAGSGKMYSVVGHLGVGLAAAPEDVEIVANDNNTVTVSWTPVAKDFDGMEIDPSLISYLILDSDQNQVGLVPFSTPTCTYEVKSSTQVFEYAFVIPVTEAGVNTNAGGYGYSEMICVGPAYKMPFRESFADGELHYIWAVSEAEEGEYVNGWMVASECDLPECTPVDNDGGMLVWRPAAVGDGAGSRFFGGKIHVYDSEYSKFAFSYYATPGQNDYTIQPLVIVDGDAYTLGDKINVGAADVEEGWTTVELSLEDYTGLDIQVAIDAYCVSYESLLCLDNLMVATFADKDLGVATFKVPANFVVGSEATVGVTVANYGKEDVDSYSVELLLNGESYNVIESTEALAAGEVAPYVFSVEAGLFWPESMDVQARVVFADDQVADNDASDVVNVPVDQNNLPAVKELDGAADGANVTLTWSKPDLNSFSSGLVDDVESYESFEVNNAGGWSFYDGDESETYGFSGIAFPNAYYVGSFIVFDKTINDSFEDITHSGDKVFACFAATSGQNDDWMISPELGGFAQTVSFFAKTHTDDYGNEEFEFLYSTTGNNPEDFIKLAEDHNVPTEWTEYSYNVPEGTKYFAIRCVSADRFIFLVDDISFAIEPSEITLTGYNIYRDGEKIAWVNGSTNVFTDTAASGEAHTYHVTAVYANGESALSPAYLYEPSGIEAITALGLKVYTEGRTIVVAGAEGQNVSVSMADGRTTFAGVAPSTLRVPALQGVHVVTIGRNAVKVIVK